MMNLLIFKRRWIRIKAKWFSFRRRLIAKLKLKRVNVPLMLFYSGFFSTYDIYSDQWDLLNNRYATWLYWVMWVVPVLLSPFVLSAAEKGPFNSTDAGIKVYCSFISSVGIIVSEKIKRFRELACNLPKRKTKDRFDQVTDTKSQFRVISRQAVEFFKSMLIIENDDQINITVLRKRPGGEFAFIHRFHDNWTFTSEKEVTQNGSGSRIALERGEPVLFIDKQKHADRGEYLMSNRDKRRGYGSAYFFPVVVPTNNGTFEHVVCIVTYGAYLADDELLVESKNIQTILSEICQRFELEICLHTIKTK
jgi:hypothetical protein